MLHICCIYHICQDTDTLLSLMPVTKHSLICIIMEEKKKQETEISNNACM